MLTVKGSFLRTEFWKWSSWQDWGRQALHTGWKADLQGSLPGCLISSDVMCHEMTQLTYLYLNHLVKMRSDFTGVSCAGAPGFGSQHDLTGMCMNIWYAKRDWGPWLLLICFSALRSQSLLCCTLSWCCLCASAQDRSITHDGQLRSQCSLWNCKPKDPLLPFVNYLSQLFCYRDRKKMSFFCHYKDGTLQKL